MSNLSLETIGAINIENGCVKLILEQKYIPALIGLEGFSHIQVLWWLSSSDNPADRSRMTEDRPYKNGPDILGTFATRSPCRPNPIALDCSQVIYIDHDKGIIGLTWLDAFNGSPILDIKPYIPAIDRVETPKVPHWCSHWPHSYEESESYDWENVFNS
ncbi:TPA: TrmO family methyltransferase domain-containing protein [Salmonella enterica subsp. enterica serovar Warragul]|nr:SAM-dependent methyltransferase [Salmonella enterica subsp. enterica]EHI7576249.1 SAM-dependent methyltransferase [Salmonella enterica]EHI7576404.1 SAM-dependent methyltransferase [Salmonella enterica]